MRQLVSVLDEEQLRYYVADDDGELRQIALIVHERSFTPEAVAQLGLNLQAAISSNGARRTRAVHSPPQLPRAAAVEQTTVQHQTARRRVIEPPPRRLGKRVDPSIVRQLLDGIAQLPPEGLPTDQLGELINMRARVVERLKAIERQYHEAGLSAPFELVRRRARATLVVPREQHPIEPRPTRSYARYDYPSETQVLDYIRAHPGCTPTDIASALEVDMSDTRRVNAWRYRLSQLVKRTPGVVAVNRLDSDGKRRMRLHPRD